MANSLQLPANNYLAYGPFNVATKAGLALSSAYLAGVSGAAVGMRFIAPTTGNLTDVYLFITAITGVPGNLTVELHPQTSATQPNTGTTHATQTVAPGVTANKWIRCTFGTPFSVTQGVAYWITPGDAAGGGVNFATVGYQGGIASSVQRQMSGFTSADGFATAGTLQNSTPPMVLKFSDGTLFGNPFTTNAAYANNQRERGLKIVSLTENLVINGATWSNPSSNQSGLKIYSGATAPGGTPDLTVTFGNGAASIGSTQFPAFTLKKSTIYRIVLTFSANNTGPNYVQIEDFSGNTDITNCAFAGGQMYGTQDDGAGGWTDSIDQFPRMEVITQDLFAAYPAMRVFSGM